MFRLSALLFMMMFLPGSLAAESLQIQLRGSVPDNLSAELVLLDAASKGCQDTPCPLLSRDVRIPRHAKGPGILNVEVSKRASQACLRNVRTHRIVGAMVHFRDERAPLKIRRGANIAKDGSWACTPQEQDIAEARIWQVTLKK